MIKIYYGWELLSQREWTPTELLKHIRAGLPVYDEKGEHRIYDIDYLPTTEDPILQQKLLTDGEWRREKDESDYPVDVWTETAQSKRYKGKAKAMNFALPDDKDERTKLFKKIKSFRFKHQDCIDYIDRLNNPILNPYERQQTIIKNYHMRQGAKQKSPVSKITHAAVEKFLKEHPQVANLTKVKMADEFRKHHDEDHPILINDNGVTYEVFREGDNIYSIVYANYEEKKTREHLMNSDTFIKNYLPKVRKKK